MTAFGKTDAVTLANNILENSDIKLAEFLSQEFSGYPILIVQGAQLLNQVPGLDKEEYKKKIQQSTDRIKLNITLAIKELKPRAKELLNKIALINNQGFSKDLLRIITNDKNNLDDDLYQLSKFALIANIDPNEDNPIFEMHDVIAEKVAEMNGNKNNKNCLEEVISRLVNAVPKSVVKGRAFRNSKTIAENIAIISSNSEKYDISSYKLMALNLQLIIQYANSLDLYNTEKLVNWFSINDQQSNFKLWLMNNDEKSLYAAYLGLIGEYYRRCSKHHTAIEYYTKAKKIYDNVKGYEAFKCNTIYCLAMSNVILGEIKEAEKYIQTIKNLLNTSFVDKSDVIFIYSVRAQLLSVQGKYTESLEQINKTIETCIKNGISLNDLFLTNPYILHSEILNFLNQYQEAYAQAQQLYEMHKPVKKEDHAVFGQIFTQMSRAQLGLGNAKEALEYARKARTIFMNDPTRPNNSRNIAISPDIYLAKACVAEADALAALGQNEKAAKSYLDAENFYWNNYREKMGNVDEVSRMYLSAAKASCHLREKAWYIKFHDQHIKQFGADHPRTIEILNMDDTCYPQSQR